MKTTRALTALCATALLLPAIGACSVVGEKSDGAGQDAGTSATLVTHDSFVLPKDVIHDFEQQSGYHLVVHAAGDGGTLTNKLVLTKGDPTGDVAFGVDNTFATRALDAGVFAPNDNGNVCVNVDTTWFRTHHLAAPRSLDDLVKPAYRDLLAVPGATTSSTGLAFLLGTIGKYG